MAITLAQARLTEQDKFHAAVIDEFRKSSFLMDNLIFDDTASATGNGSSFGYIYDRVKTQASAGTRAINAEYTPQEAEVEQFATILRVLGGAFEIDRVVAASGGIIDRVAFQFAQKIKALTALFSDLVINGDNAVNANAFDGLEKALTGSSTEFNQGSIDLSTAAAVTANYVAFLDALDEFLMTLDGTPTVLASNTKMIAKIRAVARRADMYQTTKDDFGRQVEYYGNVPLIDLGAKSGSNSPIVPITGGVAPLYAIRMGLDGFHGISPTGQPLIKAYKPNFEDPGAVKKGEVEMVAAVALKATKAAGVMRGIKVASA